MGKFLVLVIAMLALWLLVQVIIPAFIPVIEVLEWYFLIFIVTVVVTVIVVVGIIVKIFRFIRNR